MRRALVLAFALVAATTASGQDRFLRTVSIAETVAPLGLLLVQGIDDGTEAALLTGAILLHSTPSALLLIAESAGNAPMTRLFRLVSSGAAATSAAVSLGMGIAVFAGAFPELGWREYAPSLMAASVPALFAALVDLLPYAIEGSQSEP